MRKLHNPVGAAADDAFVKRRMTRHWPNVFSNAVDPGWVRTRMGGQGAPRSRRDGARTPVWLALLPDGGPNGGFFRDEHAIPW